MPGQSKVVVGGADLRGGCQNKEVGWRGDPLSTRGRELEHRATDEPSAGVENPGKPKENSEAMRELSASQTCQRSTSGTTRTTAY